MDILAHRGLWHHKDERNTLASLCNGLDEGFGLETDVRDLNGQLVISHDLPFTDCSVFLEQLLRYYSDGRFTSILGLNIKSDGLQEKLCRQLLDYNIKNYFVFDMSIPDTLGYLKHDMPIFIRRSDLEHHPELVSLTQGVWLDELIKPWIDSQVLLQQTLEAKAVCIVSSELHGWEHEPQWKQIEDAMHLGCPSSKLLLCTDFPRESERYFK